MHKYAILISLWLLVLHWPFITHKHPDIDLYDLAQWYPGFSAGTVHVCSHSVQEALADPVLQNAVIIELHDFTGTLLVHLTSTWFQKKVHCF